MGCNIGYDHGLPGRVTKIGHSYMAMYRLDSPESHWMDAWVSQSFCLKMYWDIFQEKSICRVGTCRVGVVWWGHASRSKDVPAITRYIVSLKGTDIVRILFGLLWFSSTSRPYHWDRLTLITSWISNYIQYNVWDEITYLFPNFNGAPLKFTKG